MNWIFIGYISDIYLYFIYNRIYLFLFIMHLF